MCAACAACAACAGLSPAAVGAQSAGAARPDTALRVAVGAYVDAYLAYDAGRPRALDRAFTTQAARHAEFNVNLAFVDVTLTAPRVRGRLAAQFGTAVQANYAAEPRVGTLSGPEVSRFIQEATGGYRVAPSVWVDAGVLLSPFGSENWISRDNWTYTRSLIADNSPYYEAGVRATWQASRRLSAQLHVINGWQNVSETNGDKAVGVRLDYAPSARVTLAYDAFVGNEQPDTLPRRLRAFQEVIVRAAASERVQLAATFDYGVQRRPAGAGSAAWRGFAVLARYRATSRLAVAARGEGYSDPEQVIVATGGADGLRASGASLDVDVSPAPRLLWRTELRGLRARSALFPDRAAPGGLSRGNLVAVTSLALTL